MTGTVEADDRKDASEELLASSILASLLLLRYSAWLRSMAGERLDDLHSLIRQQIAAADLLSIPLSARRTAANRLAEQIEALVEQVYSRLYRDLTTELVDLGATLVEHTVSQINKAVAEGAAKPVERSKLGEAVGAALVAGAVLSDWFGRQGGDLGFRLRRLITDAGRNGAGPMETAAGVMGAVSGAKRQADTIVSSAVTSAHATAVDQVVRANDGISVKGYLWCSVLDSRTTPECRSRANLRFLSDGTPVGHSKPFRYPPIHPNCRSSLVPWLLASDDMPPELRRQIEAADRSGALTGRAPKEPTLDEFLKSRNETEQKRILGLKQWQLWRQGKITTAGLLDQSSRPITLQQLRRLLGLD